MSKGSKQGQTTEPVGIVCGNVHVNRTIWDAHEARFERLRLDCPHVHIGADAKDSPRAVAHKERDAWGCLWHYPGMYLDGQVIEHPLDSWDRYAAWKPPSAAEQVERIMKRAEEARAKNRPMDFGVEHGFLFLRLTYLRGFENAMVDVAEENPRLYELRDVVADYWQAVVGAYADCGARSIHFGDDLGLQDRLPISPAAWRKLVKPAYSRIFGLARARGIDVRLHTDGYILDIIGDLIDCGVTTLNPQDLVNGLENLARLAKGRVHINLDIDRQRITAFGRPEEVDAHVARCVRALGSPSGGLSLVYGAYPGTPPANIEAVARAMERYRGIWVN